MGGMHSDADNSSSTRPPADVVQEPEETAERCDTDAPPETTEANYEQLQEAGDFPGAEFQERRQSFVEQLAEPAGDIFKSIARSNEFSMIVAVVIGANVLTMAVETDFPGWGPWNVINNSFLVFFVIELFLRLYSYRLGFFTGPDLHWNYFDFVIVVLGVADQWLVSPLVKGLRGSESTSDIKSDEKMSKFAMLARIIRVLRILRIFRLFRRFRELLILTTGLIESTFISIWIAVLLVMLIVVCAIFTTNVVGQLADTYQNSDEISYYWGSMSASMITLFQFLTLDNWSYVVSLVVEENPAMYPFFLIFLILSAFIFLALLTGVVADKMSDVIQEVKHCGGVTTRGIAEQSPALLFGEWFQQGNYFSRSDYDQLFSEKDEHFLHKLYDDHGISLGADDVRDLFGLLDKRGEGKDLLRKDLVTCLVKFQAEARPEDLMKIHTMITALAEEVKLAHPKSALDTLSASVKDLEERFKRVESETHRRFNIWLRRRELEKSSTEPAPAPALTPVSAPAPTPVSASPSA